MACFRRAQRYFLDPGKKLFSLSIRLGLAVGVPANGLVADGAGLAGLGEGAG